MLRDAIASLWAQLFTNTIPCDDDELPRESIHGQRAATNGGGRKSLILYMCKKNSTGEEDLRDDA